jgi:hypothetical protein
MRVLPFALALLLPVSALADDLPVLDLDRPVTWPRSSVTDFGCLVERELGVRDERFNCDLQGYVNQRDPCTDIHAYYEGFLAPRALRERLAVDDVYLAWEHGELQAAVIVLEPLSEAEWRARLALPDPLPKNVQAVSFHSCTTGALPRRCTILALVGFDRIDAGDVDCPSD